MDSSAVVEVSAARPRVRLPDDFELPASGVHIRAHDGPHEQEERLRRVKLPAALAFARANDLCHVALDAPRPRLVLVASGKGYTDARQALADLGIDARVARDLGLRLVKVGMPWPLDGARMRELVAGAESVLVVEEKRAFVEAQLKEQLYELPDSLRPRVLGKHDAHGAPLLSQTGELSSVEVARAIARCLPAGVSTERIDDHLARLAAEESVVLPVLDAAEERSPFFCSGCPHNRSTQVPEGSRALVGIGCHYMVQWMDRSSDQFCQMGGEGAAWIGQAPFTDEPHVFANLGDGTYLHSGVLAIRAAVAAGVRITYKLLYNGAVAMTGGQPLDGTLDVPQITRQLAAEGVREIVVVAEEPGRYRDGCGLAAGVRVEPRERLEAVQKSLRECEGVSVLIYDQACAAEKRRKRRRGQLPEPTRRVFIHETVCEGCGDCSTVSNCLSVEPVETEWGRKRRIDQTACNKDYSCLEGSCPAFVSVLGGELRRRVPADLGGLLDRIPEPTRRAPRDGVCNVVVAGVGGTGVTTVAALLGMAAHLEGRASGVLDMTGLAQKGGAVVSHVRIADRPDAIHGTRIPARSADLLLACDPVVGASPACLESLHAARTRSLLDTHVAATAAFVMDNHVRWDESRMLARVERSSRECDALDASHIAAGMLGDAIGSNILLLGHAYQKGELPLSSEAIERAIELNGVAVEMNLRAFALGRLAAHDRKRIDDWMAEEAGPVPELDLAGRMARRVAVLTDYQSAAWAARYRGWLERVQAAESACVPGSQRLTSVVADRLFELMSYKDEYEVARLYASPAFRDRLEHEFSGDYRVELHLAPPLFARRDPDTGRLRKHAYGPWMLRAMKWLARGKRLRGSRLDPFGRLPERRLERALIGEYEASLGELLARLTPDRLDLACRLAGWSEPIRGFDRIKTLSAERARSERDRLLAELRG
jgi:indolepyruvate ferredoxin oxidoreductase